MAHVRPACADVLIDFGANIANGDCVVSAELNHGLNQLFVRVSANRLGHVTSESVFFWLMPASWHYE